MGDRVFEGSGDRVTGAAPEAASERRITDNPRPRSRAATASKRSGRRGATARKGQISSGSDSQAVTMRSSSPSPVDAATRTGLPTAAAAKRAASENGGGVGGAYFTLPRP